MEIKYLVVYSHFSALHQFRNIKSWTSEFGSCCYFSFSRNQTNLAVMEARFSGLHSSLSLSVNFGCVVFKLK